MFSREMGRGRTQSPCRLPPAPHGGRASAGLVKHAVLFRIFRYRPLGCPVIHIARVLRFNHSIATVHLVGPVHLISGSPALRDIGICMVAGFEGVVSLGRRPDVGGR